ncbi:MAG TPA: hypothetical protein VHF22_12790, partial [Planctomycetota bacterium]|nr:hypothetical protein [Planctomycetota bacterium]
SGWETEPAWRSLGSFSLAAPVARMGLAIPRGDVLFVRPRADGAALPLAGLPVERRARPDSVAVDLSVP